MKKLFSILMCGILVTACVLATFSTNKESILTPTRDVDLIEQNVEINSDFEKFDSYEIAVDDNVSEFEGITTLTLSNFSDIDYVSDSNISETATLKFTSSFDYNTGITTLAVLLVGEEDIKIIDTVYGVALIADTGEVDIVFDFDGELIFLSQLRNSGMIDNVGWFKNLVKKAVTAVVSTVETTIKVLSTSNGIVGTVTTLAACAVVGTACAFIPGGQIVTTVCASIAGSIVGGVGFNLTAKAAQKQNSSITDEDINTYTTVGTIVGSTVSVASSNAMAAFRTNKGVGNPVKIEGRGCTGRNQPNNLFEQMSMHEVQSNPLQNATNIPVKLNDARWPASEGWIKKQVIVKGSNGEKSTIHYVYNTIKNLFDDFKFI